MTILERLKNALELEGIDAYDTQVLEYANQDISFLINNNIPLTQINESTESFEDIESSDVDVVIEYLTWNAMIKLDRSFLSSSATANYIEMKIAVCLNQLKAKYDVE